MVTLSLFHSFALSPPNKIREFTIRENDTASYTLKLALDNNGRPVYFFRNVFTPVCLTGECKPVYINFYWDLVGNYTRYDLPPNQILTKMDHKEFKPEDYEKLRDILANPNSLLKDVAMDDLVGKGTENLADSVDAKAGATLKTVKNEVIDGAVYTCYTLWHLAHGNVVNEIRRITETYQDDQLLHSFLTSTNHHYQYWAMDRVIDAQGTIWDGFLPDILTIIQGRNVFTARYALQRIANPFFLSDARQKWLWETYQKAGYSLQIVILKRLANIPFKPVLTEAIAQELPKANQEQSTMLLNLLASQPTLNDKTQQLLARQLTSPTQDNSAAIYQLLKGLHPHNQEVRTYLKTFETTASQINK
ncbi:hypothetical protein WBJ53_28415 [Spirosoma sp. SC4-14]|uniref:hypothetical protein n=1 Tax=Spirosoma sp. SC4-14 TaxID=3128900 RepID=UPI0030D615DA